MELEISSLDRIEFFPSWNAYGFYSEHFTNGNRYSSAVTVDVECDGEKVGVLSLLERSHERVDPILKFHGGEGQSLALGLWGNALWGNRLPGLVHGYGHGLGGGHVAMVAWQEEQAGAHCYDDHGGGAPPEQRGLAAWRNARCGPSPGLPHPAVGCAARGGREC